MPTPPQTPLHTTPINSRLMLLPPFEANALLRSARNDQAEFVARTQASLPSCVAQASLPTGSHNDRDPFIRAGNRAIIMVDGLISFGSSCWWNWGVSTQAIVNAINVAREDDTIDEVVFDLDCPGGTVAGMDDLVHAVEMLVAVKPAYAFIHEMACSAAYWMISGCTAIFATPSSQSGSLGAITIIEDTSAMAQKDGSKVHAITEAPLKSIGIYGIEIDERMLDHERAIVAQMGADFRSKVAQHRPMTDQQILDMQGSVAYGRAQVAAGLADGIMHAEEFYQSLLDGSLPRPSARKAVASQTSSISQPTTDAAKAAKETAAMPMDIEEIKNAINELPEDEQKTLRADLNTTEEDTKEETGASTETTEEETEEGSSAKMTVGKAIALLKPHDLPEATLHKLAINAQEENQSDTQVLQSALLVSKETQSARELASHHGGLNTPITGGGGSTGTAGAAKAKIESLVADEMKKSNCNRQIAMRRVLKANAALHDQWIAEAKASRAS